MYWRESKSLRDNLVMIEPTFFLNKGEQLTCYYHHIVLKEKIGKKNYKRDGTKPKPSQQEHINIEINEPI
jgi:hypothetical protein